MSKLLTLEELAELTDLAPRTIRLYQTQGAIQPVKVPGNGNRAYYDRRALAKLLAMCDADTSLQDRASAEVVEYTLHGESRVADLVSSVLVDGSLVMFLGDGTMLVRKPLPKEVFE
jgi:phage terminase Nu1 subunit (DNA packaging protein)